MATKKTHQPLLYIHQPDFDKQAPSMQQFFMTKKSKQNESKVNKLSLEQESKEKLIGPEVIENVSTEPSTQQIKLEYAPKIDLVFLEESSDTNVMEFMLEEILTPRFEPELNEEVPSKIIQNTKQEKVLESSNNLMKYENILEIDLEKGFKSQKKVNKGTFNELSLENKLKQLSKTALVAKVKYEFITIDKKFKGYFSYAKKGEIFITPFDSTELITIPEKSIIGLNIIGL